MRAWETGTVTLKATMETVSGENNVWPCREKCCGEDLDVTVTKCSLAMTSTIAKTNSDLYSLCLEPQQHSEGSYVI